MDAGPLPQPRVVPAHLDAVWGCRYRDLTAKHVPLLVPTPSHPASNTVNTTHSATHIRRLWAANPCPAGSRATAADGFGEHSGPHLLPKQRRPASLLSYGLALRYRLALLPLLLPLPAAFGSLLRSLRCFGTVLLLYKKNNNMAQREQ